MRGGVPRGGPARGGAVRGAPAGRGGPPAQPGRGAVANRARAPAPGSQRMPPPPRPPAQESYEDYVSLNGIIALWIHILKFSFVIFIVFVNNMVDTPPPPCFPSPMTKVTQNRATNPTTTITVSHRRESKPLYSVIPNAITSPS